jgi:hypothetical protein
VNMRSAGVNVTSSAGTLPDGKNQQNHYNNVIKGSTILIN